jgi:hypothetical protein
MKPKTFNEFCHKYCDGLYEPRLSEDKQCTGYHTLKRMVKENITPASLEEIKRWETQPTPEELITPPHLKYMRALHPLLRPVIIDEWDKIKVLPL